MIFEIVSNSLNKFSVMRYKYGVRIELISCLI